MARQVLITGGNSGIGKVMAETLAVQGDHVIIASRDLARSQAVATAIQTAHPNARIEAMALDLARFDDVDRFAQELRRRMPVIDVLILNAGLYTHGTRQLDNGFEAMIGIMHFGHFRLTHALLDSVRAADAGRIVVTSSMLHRIGRIREDTFRNPQAHRMALLAYSQAKLANILFTRELARRLADARVTANCFHPGPIATGIWAELPRPLQRIIDLGLITPERGADTGIWLASAEEAGDHSGEYFVKRKVVATSAAGRDIQRARRLWEYSTDVMTGT